MCSTVENNQRTLVMLAQRQTTLPSGEHRIVDLHGRRGHGCGIFLIARLDSARPRGVRPCYRERWVVVKRVCKMLNRAIDPTEI